MSLLVDTSTGLLRGVRRRGARQWRGIPYADAPVEALRWRAPQAARPWTGVRDASRHGAVSPQPVTNTFTGAGRRTPQSEDCLTVTVTAPADVSATPRPVMVFIHGGAFVNGAGSATCYDGTSLVARGDIIYVSVNYRLGVLGWMHLDAHGSPESPVDSNLGLRDQLAALRWVRDNIAAFGGDPHRVTVFGESAGAISIAALLACPEVEGLIAGAIVQSAAPRVIPGIDQAHRWADELLITMGVDPAEPAEVHAWLRDVTAPQLISGLSTLSQRGLLDDPAAIAVCPAADGDLLPRPPVPAVADGQGVQVPVIIGTNDREGTLFSHFSPTNPSLKPTWRQMVTKARSFVDALDADVPDTDVRAGELLAVYPGYPKRGALADLAGDGAFWYPSVELAEGFAAHGPTWSYRYDFAPRLVRLMGVNATHAGELLPVFDQYRSALGRQMTLLGGMAEYEQLTATMQDEWLHFARHLRPRDAWPAYDAARRATRIFDTDDRVEDDPRRDRRLAWEAAVSG